MKLTLNFSWWYGRTVNLILPAGVSWATTGSWPQPTPDPSTGKLKHKSTFWVRQKQQKWQKLHLRVGGLTSDREVQGDGAQGAAGRDRMATECMNPVLHHQVDEILTCWCVSSERQCAFFLIREQNPPFLFSPSFNLSYLCGFVLCGFTSDSPFPARWTSVSYSQRTLPALHSQIDTAPCRRPDLSPTKGNHEGSLRGPWSIYTQRQEESNYFHFTVQKETLHIKQTSPENWPNIDLKCGCGQNMLRWIIFIPVVVVLVILDFKTG